MKYLLSILSITLFSLSINAQDCANMVFQTNKDGVAQTETLKQTIAAKGDYFYGIQVIKNSKGTFAKVYNVEGVDLNKGDEIILMDGSEKRVKFTFSNDQETKVMDGRKFHQNSFKLDSKKLAWLSTQPIQKFYIKNSEVNELRAFSISEDRQKDFLNIMRCFGK